MTKVTHLFELVTEDGRAAGWSESWYVDDAPLNALIKMRSLGGARANLMPVFSKIVGARAAILGGRSISDNYQINGRTRLDRDIPQMALSVAVFSAEFAQKKTFSLRGWNDAEVIGGAYSPGQTRPQLTAYAEQLSVGGFRFRARDVSQPTAAVLSIDATGIYVLGSDVALAVGDFVTLLRVRDVNGRSVTGNFYVRAVTSNRQGQLASWPTGVVVGEKGKLRRLAYTYPLVDRTTGIRVNRIQTRKVGRPFALYRGRAAVRRA